MIDHISIGVKNLTRSMKFYDAALDALGYKRYMTFPDDSCGYGTPDDRFFWIVKAQDKGNIIAQGMHVAFKAKSRTAVDKFYQAAIAAGGKDNGKPGLRPNYHPDYYAAFVIDLDGHKIEAVCHLPA